MAEPTSLAFHAMGSPCRVVVEPGRADIAAAARDLVHHLERRWSRFLPDSEVSAVNRQAGRLTVVSKDTYRLMAAAVRAREATQGRFNPLMLDQLRANGYRRSWGSGPMLPDDTSIAPGTETPIELVPELSAVRLPYGCRFDPGGIGKGLAVDRAVERCRQLGSAFASVELGGDLRVYGSPWYGESWAIGVEDPFDPANDLATFTPSEGAVTTSTTARRRWFDGAGWRHHLLDPATGRPSDSDLVTVATCSTEAWWAEVVAKTALLAGSAGVAAVFERLGAPGIAVAVDGSVVAGHGAALVKAPAKPAAAAR